MSWLFSFPAALGAGLWSTAHEPVLWFVVAVALVGGAVRGYSGFGGSLIFVPLAAMAVRPAVAVPMFYLIDLGSATPYGLRAVPHCKWAQVLPMLAGYGIVLPFGVHLLTNLDPIAVRWFMEAAVLMMLALLLSGWRYSGRPNPPMSVAVGVVAGAMASTTGMPGPPVIGYWLGQKQDAATIRTNIMAYYALSAAGMDVVFFTKGLFTWQTFLYALLVWPAYCLGLWGGVRVFRLSSDRMFRAAAFGLIGLAAIVSAPVLDRFLK